MYKGSMAIIKCDAPKCPAEILIKMPWNEDVNKIFSATQVLVAVFTGLNDQGWDMEGDRHLCHLHKPGGTLHPSNLPQLVKQR